MENYLKTIMLFFFTVLKLIFLYRLYKDTEYDPFQQLFEKDEKNNFFTRNYNKKTKVKLECSFLENLIMEPDTVKLGNIFDLRYFIFHSTSYFLFIVNILIYGSVLLFILLVMLQKFFNFMTRLVELSSGIYQFFLFGLGIAVLYYNIIIISSYYNGNSAYYLAFLECPNVNSDEFKKYTESVLLFKRDVRIYIALFICHFIYHNCLHKLISQL